MKTLGVTIGVGEEHRFYAEEAAARVRRHLGIETFILGDEYLELGQPTARAQWKARSLKFAMFDVTSDEWDRIMYFDADWRPVRDWNVDELFPDPDTIYVAPDMNYRAKIIELEGTYGLEPGSYFNSGWMIIPRSKRELFEEARAQYPRLRKFYPDQCTFNQVFRGQVERVSPAFNVMEVERWPDLANVMAVHSPESKWNYRVYKGEERDRDWEVRKRGNAEETIVRNLDYSHPWTPRPDHLVEIMNCARVYAGGSALDLGSFRGHSALAMALAGLKVTSYDNSNRSRIDREGLRDRYALDVEFHLLSAADAFAIPEQYEVVFHDTESGDTIRPELLRFWREKVKPGGLLIVHDIHLLDERALLDELDPAGFSTSNHRSNVKIGFYRKDTGIFPRVGSL